MRPELRGVLYTMAVVISSLVVGQAAAGAPLPTRLTSVGLFCFLAPS